jgi:uncharacterized paraquat-inducible protein A
MGLDDFQDCPECGRSIRTEVDGEEITHCYRCGALLAEVEREEYGAEEPEDFVN